MRGHIVTSCGIGLAGHEELLGIHTDYGLSGGQMAGACGRDVRKLRVAIRVGRAAVLLGVAAQAVVRGAQQATDHRQADRMALRGQGGLDIPQAAVEPFLADIGSPAVWGATTACSALVKAGSFFRRGAPAAGAALAGRQDRASRRRVRCGRGDGLGIQTGNDAELAITGAVGRLGERAGIPAALRLG